jgi:hypothetical protein
MDGIQMYYKLNDIFQNLKNDEYDFLFDSFFLFKCIMKDIFHDMNLI